MPAIHPVADAAPGAEGAKEQPPKPKLQQPKLGEGKKKGKKEKGAKGAGAAGDGSEVNGTAGQQGQGQQPQLPPKKQQQDKGGKRGQQQPQGQAPVVLVFEVEMGAHGGGGGGNGAAEGGERIERLELRRGQRLGPAVLDFCRQHGLDVGAVAPALEAYLRDKAPPGACCLVWVLVRGRGRCLYLRARATNKRQTNEQGCSRRRGSRGARGKRRMGAAVAAAVAVVVVDRKAERAAGARRSAIRVAARGRGARLAAPQWPRVLLVVVARVGLVVVRVGRTDQSQDGFKKMVLGPI